MCYTGAMLLSSWQYKVTGDVTPFLVSPVSPSLKNLLVFVDNVVLEDGLRSINVYLLRDSRIFTKVSVIEEDGMTHSPKYAVLKLCLAAGHSLAVLPRLAVSETQQKQTVHSIRETREQLCFLNKTGKMCHNL